MASPDSEQEVLIWSNIFSWYPYSSIFGMVMYILYHCWKYIIYFLIFTEVTIDTTLSLRTDLNSVETVKD